MGVIINTPTNDKWKKLDEISATGATGTGNHKTVSSVPSTAKELMVRLLIDDGVLATSVGFLTDGVITTRYTYAPNSQVVTQCANVSFTLSTGYFQVYVNYATSSITVKGELYYR